MSVMERRLQLLLDHARYERLAEVSRREGKSVSAVIRDAIDVAYPDVSVRRQEAAREFLRLTALHNEQADALGLPDVPFDKDAMLTEWSDSLP